MKKVIVFFIVMISFFPELSLAMSNQELFYNACKSGNYTEIQRTMSLEGADVNSGEAPALVNAVNQNRKDIVELLLTIYLNAQYSIAEHKGDHPKVTKCVYEKQRKKPLPRY